MTTYTRCPQEINEMANLKQNNAHTAFVKAVADYEALKKEEN